MQQGATARARGIEGGMGGRAPRTGVKAGQALGMEGMNGIADGLIVAAQGLGNHPGGWPRALASRIDTAEHKGINPQSLL